MHVGVRVSLDELLPVTFKENSGFLPTEPSFNGARYLIIKHTTVLLTNIRSPAQIKFVYRL